MREIRLICKKELSTVLTDRKMLFSIFLLPAIIMVVVMNVMTSFSENLENDVKSHAPMKMREIRLICKKELSTVLTDRKMLFSIFLLPAIIMVVVMNVMTSFSENLENDVKSHAPIVYLQNAPEGVEQYLKAYNEKMDLRTVDDEQKVTEEIRDGSADLWIRGNQRWISRFVDCFSAGFSGADRSL